MSLYLLLNYCTVIQTVSKRCLSVTCGAGEWSGCFIVTLQVALSSTPQRSAEEHSGSNMEISRSMACVLSTWPSTARTCCVSSWDVEPPWMETLTQPWITQRRYNTLWLCAELTHLGLTEKCLLNPGSFLKQNTLWFCISGAQYFMWRTPKIICKWLPPHSPNLKICCSRDHPRSKDLTYTFTL